MNGANGYGLLQLIPRSALNNLCCKWAIDKGVRKLLTLRLLEILIYSLVVQLRSLRELENVFFVPRSSISDACRKRSYGFFQEVTEIVLRQILEQESSRKVKKAVREILGIDSTDCHVHGSLFRFLNWRCGTRKASAKLHVVWNISKGWISDFRISSGRASDLTMAKKFQLQSSKIYVFDRAYVDINFWLQITNAQSHFVTRLKREPRLRAVHEAVLNPGNLEKTGILYDGDWTPSESACRRHGIKPKSIRLRHVIYRDPKSKKLFDFITSDMKTSALEIAAIYKKRWSVELLFRWLKGHLNIRNLTMKNKNATKILLSVAVLVQLLIRLKMLVEKLKGSAWDCLRLLRTTLALKGLQTVILLGHEPPPPLPQYSTLDTHYPK